MFLSFIVQSLSHELVLLSYPFQLILDKYLVEEILYTGGSKSITDDFQLEIVGLNKHTYETRYKVLDMNVLEKENLTKYEVHLKIDNLNVEDMFDRNRTEELLDIFRFVDKTQGKTSLGTILFPIRSMKRLIKLSLSFFFIYRKRLWKNAMDLYVTFLASAVELGARLPLKPSEGEG